MSEMRFEVTGENKAEIDREAKATIQRFMGEPADLIDLTICVRQMVVGMDDNQCTLWEATVHYEW